MTIVIELEYVNQRNGYRRQLPTVFDLLDAMMYLFNVWKGVAWHELDMVKFGADWGFEAETRDSVG